MKAILPDMSLEVIQQAGHCAMVTHGAQINQYLIEALDSMRGGTNEMD